MTAPSFLITIDTEGDDAWAGRPTVTTENAAYLARFQALCERYGMKPTYVTTWEMAQDPTFVAFGRDVEGRGTGEIGMHLHAWNSPPIVPLTAEDHRHLPYLIEYADEVMAAKIDALTDLLRSTFEGPVTSHRSGRWALDERYARLLVEHGYRVDCSVTPRISWARYPGASAGSGGTDYRGFPELPYYVNLDDIRRPGVSSLLELPMTVFDRPLAGLAERLPARFRSLRPVSRYVDSKLWLRPNGKNRLAMTAVLAEARRRHRPYVEFALHSSEFMPGGSPLFRDEASIERLYADIEAIFARAQAYVGRTLSEHAALVPPPRSAS